MTEKQPKLADMLLNLDTPSMPVDAQHEAQRVLRQDRRRITITAIVAAALWLAAAALALFLLYAFYHEVVLPQVRALDAGTYPGKPLTKQEMVTIARHNVTAIRKVLIMLSVALASVTVAALTTLALIVMVRQATLRQISSSLRAVVLGFDNSAAGTSPSNQANQVLRQDRRRIVITIALSGILWLAAATLVFWLLYTLYWDVMPKVEVLASGAMHPWQPLTEEQKVLMARHNVVVMRRVIIVLSIALGIVTVAAITTIALIVMVRQATLRQISGSLRAVVEHLDRSASGQRSTQS